MCLVSGGAHHVLQANHILCSSPLFVERALFPCLREAAKFVPSGCFSFSCERDIYYFHAIFSSCSLCSLLSSDLNLPSGLFSSSCVISGLSLDGIRRAGETEQFMQKADQRVQLIPFPGRIFRRSGVSVCASTLFVP